MIQSSLIQVRVDPELKHSTEALFGELGLDIPSAIRIFLKQVLIHNGFPFPVTKPDIFYNRTNMEALGDSIQQLNSGKVVTKTAGELEAMAK